MNRSKKDVEPIRLRPAGKDYLWGGTKLRQEYGKQLPLQPLAETWECSTHEDGLSIVAGGSFEGRTLVSVLREHPAFLGSDNYREDGQLPVLVKLIDAAKDLSIQVHPDDEYAWKHEHQSGKNEMWYVLEAKPEAKIVYGFRHKMTEEKLRIAVQKGELCEHLHYVTVQKHDVFCIPAGTIHAIGAGILLAEVQENSNITYRVYDYERLDKNGKKRVLHFEQALQVADMNEARLLKWNGKLDCINRIASREMLCTCRHFATEKIQTTDHFSFYVTQYSFELLLCIEGGGTLSRTHCDNVIPFAKGECLFLPAGMGRCDITGNMMLLKVSCLKNRKREVNILENKKEIPD